MILFSAGVLGSCGSSSPYAAGDTLPTTSPVVDSLPEADTTVTAAEPEVADSPPTSATSAVETADTAEAAIAQYGTKADGFAVVGKPVGLRLTEVPLTETVGLFGETIVSQLFTAETLDSQVTISRVTDTNTKALIEQFEAAKSDSNAETSSLVVGEARYPGYLYRDEGSGWRGLMWTVSDDSAMWVIASGLTDDEIIKIASGVEVTL